MTDSRLRVLIFAPAFTPSVVAGGPARSVTNLVKEASDAFDVSVITPDRDHGSIVPYDGLAGRCVSFEGAQVCYVNLSSLRAVTAILARVRRQKYDIVLINSFWHPRLALIPLALRMFRVLKCRVVVLAPRGELEAGALRVKVLKKRLTLPIYRFFIDREVDALAATSDSEAANCVMVMAGKRVLRTTNTPDQLNFGIPATYENQLRLIYIGRIHPIKGLETLLLAVRNVTSPIKLEVFGPVEDERYWQRCKEIIMAAPSNVEVAYGGLLRRADISEQLHASDLMVSLTRGENFGHTIAESLQAGCPVLTTNTTPWTEWLQRGGGSIVTSEPTPQEVTQVIEDWARLSAGALKKSRIAARHAFETWDSTRPPNLMVCAAGLLDLVD